MLFKVHEWWSTASRGPQEVSFGEGSLVAGRLGPHTDGDCLVLAYGSTVRVYQPQKGYSLLHLFIEKDLESEILQVSMGNFVSGAHETQLIVLHPTSYTVYSLQKKEGHADIGDQHILVPIITHRLSSKSYNLTHGNFGSMRSRELVCVQSLCGQLSFFDQELALFTCSLPDVIIPGTVSYIRSCDAFVVVKTKWIFEIYGYQKLMEFGQRGQSTNLVSQWIYNPGEEIFSLQVIQTSNNFSSIIALGERHMYCLQDNGLLKFMKKFDFMPICFRAYLMGWYYEPNSRLLIMVASDDCRLMIYESTTLLWSCELLFPPVFITPASLRGLAGALVMLSEDGDISCCYLGTEPDLSGNLPSLSNNDIPDPQTVENELKQVEEELRQASENEGLEETPEDIVKIIIEVKECVQNSHETDETESLRSLSCPMSVSLFFDKPESIQSVQISYVCSPPFAVTENVQCVEVIHKVVNMETSVYVSKKVDVSNFNLDVVVTVTDEFGRVRIIQKEALIPMRLSYELTTPLDKYEHMLTIRANANVEDLSTIFPGL